MAHKCRSAERSRQIGPKTIKSRGTTATTPFLLAILLAAVAVWLAATTSPATGADALSNVKLMNFCERMNILSNLSNPLFNAETALYNMTVVVGYNLDAPPQTITIDPETKAPVGGFIVTLLNEVSSRGAFRVTYKLVKNSSSYANTDAFLNDVLPGVDLYAGMPVADTTWRRTLYNMDFTREIVDMSIVLASPGVVVKPVLLWNFVGPYTTSLWLLLMGTILVAAGLFYAVERAGALPGMKYPPLYLVLYDYMHKLSLMDSGVKPQTLAGHVLKVGYKWFWVLTAGSYLANLANLLFAPPEIDVKVVTIADAMTSRKPVCALTGLKGCRDCAPGMATAFSVLNETYPTLKLVPVHSLDPKDLLIAVNNGRCQAAAMSFTDWDFVRNKAAGNHACDFVLDDEVIRPFSGSMALLADYGSSGSRTSRCTSCVAVVVSALLSNMRADGTLKSLYSRGRSVYWDQACRPLTRGRVMAAPLDPVDLGGVVILYLCVTVLTMGLFAAGPYVRLWCDRNVFKVPSDGAAAELPFRGGLRLPGFRPRSGFNPMEESHDGDGDDDHHVQGFRTERRQNDRGDDNHDGGKE